MRPFLFAFAVVSVLAFWRNPEVFVSPILAWDDRILFNLFHNGAGGLLLVYPDYVPLASNLIYAASFALLPTPYVPYALTILAALTHAAALAAFAHRAFASVVPDDGHRVLLVTLLAAMPVSDVVLTISPAYQNWSGLMVAVLLSAVLVVRGLAGEEMRLPWWAQPIVALCFLAHPLCVLLLPLHLTAVVLAWRRRNPSVLRQAAVFAGLAVATALWAAVTAAGAGQGGGSAGAAVLFDAAWKTPLYAVDRGLAQALVGRQLRLLALSWLTPLGEGLAPLAWYGAATAALAGLCWAGWRALRAREGAFVLALAFVTLAVSFAALATNSAVRHIPDQTFLLKAERYWYLQNVLLLLSLGMVVFAWARQAPGRRNAVALAAAVVLVQIANVDDHVQYLRYSLSGPTNGDVREAARVQRDFLLAAEEVRRSGAGCVEQDEKQPHPRLRLLFTATAAAGDCLRY